MSTSYADAVDAYAGHLRAGGTTSWSAWGADSRDRPSPVERSREPSPSAVHLELVRRINEQGGESVPGLADLVLSTPAPGRGRVDVPVPWPQPGTRFGSPPIDPARLPEEELVRVAVGVLTRLLPRVPTPPAAPELARWPVPWRRRFRLHGSPGTVAAVRAGLLEQGLVETDWRPVHIVLARPLEVMMAEHWAAATERGAHQRWTPLWRRAQATDGLPPRLDVVAIADRLSKAPGRRRDPVHLVIARDPDEAGCHGRSPAPRPRVRPTARPGRRAGRPAAPAQPADRDHTGCGARTAPRPDPGPHPRADPAARTRHRPADGRASLGTPHRGAGSGASTGGWLPCPRRSGGTGAARVPRDGATRPASGHRRSAAHPRGRGRGLRPRVEPTGGELVNQSRVLLHVGAPKTGTSFVQDILFTHRDVLRETKASSMRPSDTMRTSWPRST